MGLGGGTLENMELDDKSALGITSFSTNVFEDVRGRWQRLWDSAGVARAGHSIEVAQISVSANLREFTLRGMHSLAIEAQEFKAVICVSGSVQDVVVDVRPGSPTWGNYDSFALTPKGRCGVLVPPGFAHGFLTTSPDTTLIYVMSTPYTASLEVSFRWDDPIFSIDWQNQPMVISEKDASIPYVSLQ